MEYIGEINGTELYRGKNGSAAEYASGKWNFCGPPQKFDHMRKTLITAQSTQKCLVAARSFVDKMCMEDPFPQIPRELFSVVTLYLSACYPWQMRPTREAPIPWSLDHINVTNMVACSIPSPSILTAKHIIHATGPIESYSGVFAYAHGSTVTRIEYDGVITWSSGPPDLVYCTLAQIMLEARRNEIMGRDP